MCFISAVIYPLFYISLQMCVTLQFKLYQIQMIKYQNSHINVNSNAQIVVKIIMIVFLLTRTTLQACVTGTGSVCGSCMGDICVGCNPGYFYKYDSATSASTCQACQNCVTCTDASTCTSCMPNFYINSNSCLSCLDLDNCVLCNSDKCAICTPSYWPNSIGVCQTCGNSCVYCTSATTCASCAQGFYVNSQICTQCPSNCVCGGSSSCVSCLAGYYLASNTCLICHQSCRTCSTSETACGQCAFNYIKNDDGTCTQNSCSYYQYYDTSAKACNNCDISCLTCLGGTSSDCTSCLGSSLTVAVGSTKGSCTSPSNCIVSSSAAVCTLCARGFYLESDACTLCHTSCRSCTGAAFSDCGDCVNGFYLSTTSCIACATGCDMCTSDSDCLACPSCNDGYLCVGSTCEACVSPCATCYLSQTNCTSCAPTYLLDGNDCSTSCGANCVTCTGSPSSVTCLVCLSNFYLSGNQCTTCGTDCQACYLSGQSVVCVFCLQTSVLVQGTCVGYSGCTATQYVAKTGCVNCASNCLSCNSEGCLSCSLGYQLSNKVCSATCPQNCAVCFDTQCIQCSPTFYPNGNACATCITNCDVCVAATGCLACEPSFYRATTDGSSSCEACPASCTSGCTSATACLVCSFGYYQTTQGGECTLCAQNCASCSDQSTCLSCKNGFLLFQGACIQCSTTQFYRPTPQSCIDCHSSCLTCQTQTACTECNAGLNYLQENGVCGTCPTTSYVNNNVCKPCPEKCLTCNSATHCTACVSTASLYSAQCMDKCPDGFYSSSNVCLACDSTCSTCLNSTACVLCRQGLVSLGALGNSLCAAVTPELQDSVKGSGQVSSNLFVLQTKISSSSEVSNTTVKNALVLSVTQQNNSVKAQIQVVLVNKGKAKVFFALPSSLRRTLAITDFSARLSVDQTKLPPGVKLSVSTQSFTFFRSSDPNAIADLRKNSTTTGTVLQIVCFVICLASWLLGSFRTKRLFSMVFLLLQYCMSDASFLEDQVYFSVQFSSLFSFYSNSSQLLNPGYQVFASAGQKNYYLQGSGDVRESGGVSFVVFIVTMGALILFELIRNFSSLKQSIKFNFLALMNQTFSNEAIVLDDEIDQSSFCDKLKSFAFNLSLRAIGYFYAVSKAMVVFFSTVTLVYGPNSRSLAVSVVSYTLIFFQVCCSTFLIYNDQNADAESVRKHHHLQRFADTVVFIEAGAEQFQRREEQAGVEERSFIKDWVSLECLSVERRVQLLRMARLAWPFADYVSQVILAIILIYGQGQVILSCVVVPILLIDVLEFFLVSLSQNSATTLSFIGTLVFKYVYFIILTRARSFTGLAVTLALYAASQLFFAFRFVRLFENESQAKVGELAQGEKTRQANAKKANEEEAMKAKKAQKA